MCLFSGTEYGVTIEGTYAGRESNWCIFHCFRNVLLDIFLFFFCCIYHSMRVSLNFEF